VDAADALLQAKDKVNAVDTVFTFKSVSQMSPRVITSSM
jgi:hypothetical protein